MGVVDGGTPTELKADLARGLNESEVRAHLAQYGPNQLQEQKGRSPLSIFADQFADMIVWVLIGAAIVSGGTAAEK